MKLLRVKQVAAILGTSERTIWNKIKQGRLPVLTIAGITRIDGEKLQQDFVQQGLNGSLQLNDLEADFQLMEGT